MNFEMNSDQLREIYRDEKQIRVRFTEAGIGSDRYHLVRNKTKLRGTGLYIRERLTPYRQKIFNELMQFKRAQQISTVFTRDGVVFVVIGRGDRPRPVQTEVAMERLIRHLLESEPDSHQQIAAGSQQARDSGAAGMSRIRETPAPERPAAATGGATPRSVEQRAEPLSLAPGGDRRGSPPARGQHQQPTGGSGADGEGRVQSRSTPEIEASPAASLELVTVTGRPASLLHAGLAPSSGSAAGEPLAGRQRPSSGGDDEGDGGPTAVTKKAPAMRTNGRLPAAGNSTVRRRFQGDMRQFVTIHTP